MKASNLSPAEMAACARNLTNTQLLLQFIGELNCDRQEAALALLTAGTVLIEQDCHPDERLIRLNDYLGETVIAWAQPTPGSRPQ